MKRLGFTLVEVLVVLTIISLISAISFSTLTSFITEANQERGLIEAKEVYLAASLGDDLQEVYQLANVSGTIVDLEYQNHEVSYLSYISTNKVHVVYQQHEFSIVD